MSCDIVLIQCPMMSHYWPPIGLGYLCEYLRKHGYQPRLMDLNIECFHGETNREIFQLDYDWVWYSAEEFARIQAKYADLMDQQARRIVETDAPVIGFTVSATNARWTREVARRVRQSAPDRLVIFGGSEFIMPESALGYQDEANVFVIGEGEGTLLEILQAHQRGESLAGIQGARISNHQGSLTDFEAQPMQPDLDGFPFPTYKETDLKRYLFPNVCISSSRGCVRRCAFCNDHPRWVRFRSRSAGNVIAEMEYHARMRLSETFYITSSLLNANLDWLDHFCEALIRKRFRWDIITEMIVDPRMSREVFRKVRKAGISRIEYGLESGSDHVLRAMNKGFTQDQAKRAIEDTHAAGIVCEVNLITGFPGETESDHEETKRFLTENAASIDVIKIVHTCSVLPNSPLRIRYQEFGIEDPDNTEGWRIGDSNTLEIRQQRKMDLIHHARSLRIELAFEHQPTGLKSYLKPRFLKQTFRQPLRSYRKARRILRWKQAN